MRAESLFEGARLALDQLRANKFRSALTIIGIVVGVAVVMAMSGLIEGVRSSVMSELENVGPNNFMIARYNFAGVQFGDMDGPPWGDNPAITVAEARAINQLPGIRMAAAGVDESGEFTYESQRVASVQVLGRENGWTEYTSGNMVAGHDMLEHDVRSSAPVIILSAPLAETLFGPLDPIGRTIRVKGVPFEVIGVFEQSANIFASIQRNWAVAPYTAVLKHLNAWDGMLLVFAVPHEGVAQDEAIDQVITTLRTSRGLTAAADNNFAIIRQEQMVDTFNQITGVFFIVMLALSSVALMVGGVGVIAIMMIAVTERTREIGIRKAIGATRNEILWQFLFESATVTVIGGIIGMAIGASIAFLVAGLTPIPARVPFLAVVAALGMAAVSGVLFGMWPAWKASRLDPVAALRYE
jgi:putative ABC transport system permease protein